MKLSRLLLTCLAPFFFALHASAQGELVFQYDAGAAGNPAMAPTPESQGWTFDGNSTTTFQGLSPDGNTGRNAWSVSDLSTASGSTGRYTRIVPSFQVVAANTLGFRVDVDLRMIASGSARTINFEYLDRSQSPPQRYLVYLVIDSLDVIAEPFNGTERRAVGAMDGEYHRFSIVQWPGATFAELHFDGLKLGNFSPFDGPPNAPEGYVAFGAGSSGGTGIANFSRVQFSVLRPNAGQTFCSPANVNSTGDAAVIQATGSVVASDGNLVLYARNLPANQFGFFLNGTNAGFASNPGGSQGNLCLGGAIGRYNSQIQNSGPFGEMAITLDLTQTPSAGGAVPILAGQTWHFQGWFRDNNPGPTSNFTNGTRVIFQ